MPKYLPPKRNKYMKLKHVDDIWKCMGGGDTEQFYMVKVSSMNKLLE